jgi:hypothetical protein
MPKYRKPEQEKIDPYKAQPLPLGRPVAVYYRQSSEGQIGNISTTLQTVDMVEHLQRQGWQREQIIMIDMDAGVSGTKKIDERPGMSYLHRLIEDGEIGLVASQDVDRFFRDVTQIQTNIFIDTCKRNNVQVLTPTFVYDFAHPTQGRYHMQMFRDHAQRAADYLEFHIKGRLAKSKQFMLQQGLWVGGSIALGYIVDMRSTLPNGNKNPNWRKYVRFDPHAEVVIAWYGLFKQYEGNLKRTWEHIEEHGPFVPEANIPEGYYFRTNIRKRSRITGGRMLSLSSLGELLHNVVYAGHWTLNGVIVQRHNHEAIVPSDLFSYAFNRLSPNKPNGDTNPYYEPYRPRNRHLNADRAEEPPTYSGAVFSSDIPDVPLKRMSTNYMVKNRCYYYRLDDSYKQNYLTVTARYIDEAIDELLLERLQATTVDEEAWQQAVDSTRSGTHMEVRRLENAIRTREDAQQSILENLQSVAHPDLVKRLEDSYIVNDQEIKRLQAELEEARVARNDNTFVLEARPVLETVIRRWDEVERVYRRDLFDGLAERVMVSKIDLIYRCVTVHWRDSSQSSRRIKPDNFYISWTQDELETLREMIESSAPQVDILRRFPGPTWRAIQERYAYHFNNKRYFAGYNGERKYGKKTRWQDTEEFTQEQESQIPVSVGSLSAWKQRSMDDLHRQLPISAPVLLR